MEFTSGCIITFSFDILPLVCQICQYSFYCKGDTISTATIVSNRNSLRKFRVLLMRTLPEVFSNILKVKEREKR